LLGICATWRTGDRLAITGSTDRLIPSLRVTQELAGLRFSVN
jgi:hypothetical protein